jgi:hypothetical protein
MAHVNLGPAMRKARKMVPRIPAKSRQVPVQRKGSAMRPRGIVVVVDGDPSSEDEVRYRDLTLKHEYLFDDDLREDYEKAKHFVQKRNNAISDDEFRFRLGEIVYMHRKRYQQVYNKIIAKYMNNAKLASELVGNMWNDLAQLDHEYRDVVLAIASHSISQDVLTMSSDFTERKAQLARLIAIAGHITSAFNEAFELGTRLLCGAPSPTKPKTPYAFEAYKLSELWFFLTGERVVYPRPVKGEVSPHDSTEFVRLGIKMIDPKSKLAQADTSMKRARYIKKSYEELVLGNASSDHVEIIEAIRRLLD